MHTRSFLTLAASTLVATLGLPGCSGSEASSINPDAAPTEGDAGPSPLADAERAEAGKSAAAPSQYVTVSPDSEFVPCQGYTIPAPGAMNPGGPWTTRLLLAESDDGLSFRRTGLIVTDQGDVPDVLVQDGEIRVYYVAGCPAEVQNRIVVATSRDGLTFRFRKTALLGERTYGPDPVDPTVERTDDGRIRLYFTSDAVGQGGPGGAGKPSPRTFSAISDDGYSFTMETGYRFHVEGQNALDPTVLKIGSTWHYFAGGAATSNQGKNYHATSADGFSFTRVDDFSSGGMLMSNGIARPNGGYRYYGFIQGPGTASIVSTFTEDGSTWTPDPGFRLEIDAASGLEQNGVKDPGIGVLPSGKYVMVYVSEMPGVVDRSNPPPPPGPGGG